jgi:hypothetical protein
MSVLARTINSNDVGHFGSTSAIVAFFVNTVVKRLSISTTDALVNPSIVNPEQAYQIQ